MSRKVSNKRKYPRIPFERAAEVEFLDRGKGSRVRVPATITSIACEGVGLTSNEPLELDRKTRVSVIFNLGDGELVLPGAVAWRHQRSLGVHLLLQLALAPERQRWAHWIVEQTSQFRSDRRRRVTADGPS